MTDWTAALHPTAAGMPPMQQPATITPQQGGYKISQPPAKVKAPPPLKQPKPAVPFKPAKPVKAPAAPAAAKKANRPAGSYDPAEFLDDGYHPSQWLQDRDMELRQQWEQQHKEQKGANVNRLAGADRRWVELESARFIAANRDTLDDSHELAVRAHNHAAAKTSTFTRQRSAAVCEAFVRKVTQLGEQQYRPAPQRTAAINTNFPDSLMFL